MDKALKIEITDITSDGRGFGRTKDGLAVFVDRKIQKKDGGVGTGEGYAGEAIEPKKDGGAGTGEEYAGEAIEPKKYNGSAAEGGQKKPATVVPGDFVDARITKEGKRFVQAELVKVTRQSEDRIPSKCPYPGECGGCTFRELSYEAQLALKQKQVKDKLERIGGVRFEAAKGAVLRDIVAAERLDYYRNKATFTVGSGGEVGFLARGSHRVIDVEDCLLQSDAAMVCADALRYWLKLFFSESVYNGADGNEKNRRRAGEYGIKQMMVRTAFGTGEVMVVLEADRKDIPGLEDLVMILNDAVNRMDDSKGEDTYDVSFSLESVAVVYGDDEKKGKVGKCEIIAGKPTITEEIVRKDGRVMKFEISPQSFFQVNPEQMVKLYDMVLEYSGVADQHTNKTVLDLYCGTGTIGLYLADHAEQIIGIESVKPAVLDANRNSVINGIVNTRYICGKAEEELPAVSMDHVDVAIVDPPRAGCDKDLLNAVVAAAPERIVYVSCDPATLARDVNHLLESGYELIEAAPVDMFPWTSHVECVVLMSKVKD